MLLDTINRVLQIGMLEGITTNNLDYSVEYEDKIIERMVPVINLGVIAAALAATVLAAPPNNTRRLITEINVCNLDTVNHHVVISIYDSSVPLVYSIHEATLTPGQNLHYNQYNGWNVL